MNNKVMSKYETILNALLANKGIACIPQFAVDIFNIDLAIPDRKLAIEVDGGNWHHNHPRKLAQDKTKTEYLESVGWTVLRFSNWRNPQWADDALKVIIDYLH